MRKKGGFTLVELVIVVIIIGILVTIGVPNYMRSLERSKCAQAIRILKDMRSAGLSYYANKETFPAMVTDLEDEVGANFYSDKTNNDWDFTIQTGNDTTLVLQATRQGGPHTKAPAKTIITVTDLTSPLVNKNEEWSDPSAAGNYPWDNPGDW